MSYKKLKGYALKRLVQISTDGQAVGTSLVEVKTIVNQAVPDSVFEIPASYKKFGNTLANCRKEIAVFLSLKRERKALVVKASKT